MMNNTTYPYTGATGAAPESVDKTFKKKYFYVKPHMKEKYLV